VVVAPAVAAVPATRDDRRMRRHRSLLAFVSLAVAPCAQSPSAPPPAASSVIGVASAATCEAKRPLLWANVDATACDVVVAALADGEIPYFALVTAGDVARVHGGANGAGFCVVHTGAVDLPEPPADASGPDAGALAKLALQQCDSVARFEALLRDTDGKRRTRASLAVADAKGDAAVFDVGPASFQRTDAAASANGVVVRAGAVAPAAGGAEHERRERAHTLVAAPQAKPLTVRYLLQQVLRDVRPPASAAAGGKGLQDVRATLHRDTAVAGLVLQAAAAGTDAKATAMWAHLGQPLFTVAVPLFPAAGALPRAVAGDPRSAICDAAKRLADTCYAAGDGGKAPARWLRTDAMPLVRRTVLFAEADLLARHAEFLAAARERGGAPPAALRAFQDAMSELALDAVTALADERTQPPPSGR
jgi:hypothetical protein